MRKLYSLMFILAIPFCLDAQITFQKTYGDLVYDDGQALVQTRDHGYCIVGTTGPNQTDSQHVAVYRLDSIGNLVWTSKIYGSKNDFIKDVKETADGGFILVGTTFSSPIDATNSDILAIRLDDTGYPILSSVYGGPDVDEGNSVMIVDNGGYIIAGSTKSYGTATQSAMILKIDDNLNQRWSNVSSITPLNYFNRINKTFDGGSIAVGTANNIGGTGFDTYVCKFDTGGTLTWGYRYGTASADQAFDVIQTSDSGYAITGISSAFVIGTHGFPDQHLIRLHSNGTFDWCRNYGSAQYDRASSIVQNLDGGFTMAGYTNVGDSSNPIYQVSLTRTNAAGAFRWALSYGDLINRSEATDLIKTNDEGFAFTGFNLGFSDPNGDAYLIKTDSLGDSKCYQDFPVMGSTVVPSLTAASAPTNIITNMDESTIALGYTPFINQFSTVCEDNSIDESIASGFMIYPNPASREISIKAETDFSDAGIFISNMIGQTFNCNLQKISDRKITLDISALPAGIYSIKIQTKTVSVSRKFVKE